MSLLKAAGVSFKFQFFHDKLFFFYLLFNFLLCLAYVTLNAHESLYVVIIWQFEIAVCMIQFQHLFFNNTVVYIGEVESKVSAKYVLYYMVYVV